MATERIPISATGRQYCSKLVSEPSIVSSRQRLGHADRLNGRGDIVDSDDL